MLIPTNTFSYRWRIFASHILNVLLEATRSA
jgi:hypothetical protein